MKPTTTYMLVLRAEPGDSRPPEVRLRRALKLMLRCCGLRCVRLAAEPALDRVGPDLEDK